MIKTRDIHCCGCAGIVSARRTTGAEVYPGRRDLAAKRFWVCDACGNYVGCHGDGSPLGTIPTPEIRAMRRRIHAVIDPLWRSRRVSRNWVYREMRTALGVTDYHTAELSTMEGAHAALDAARGIARRLT